MYNNIFTLLLYILVIFNFVDNNDTLNSVKTMINFSEKLNSFIETKKFTKVASAYPLSSNFLEYNSYCQDYYVQLNKAFANFTNCAASTSRPFILCQSCIEQYLRAKDIYNRINAVSFLTSFNCQVNKCENKLLFFLQKKIQRIRTFMLRPCLRTVFAAKILWRPRIRYKL